MSRMFYWQIQLGQVIKSRQENGAVLKSMNYSGIQINLSLKVNQMPKVLYCSSPSTADLNTYVSLLYALLTTAV